MAPTHCPLSPASSPTCRSRGVLSRTMGTATMPASEDSHEHDLVGYALSPGWPRGVGTVTECPVVQGQESWWKEGGARRVGRRREGAEPGRVARGPRRGTNSLFPVNTGAHTSRPPPGDFCELGKCGHVYSHSPVPAGVPGTASLPAASTAGGSQLRGGAAGRGPQILPAVRFSSGSNHPLRTPSGTKLRGRGAP